MKTLTIKIDEEQLSITVEKERGALKPHQILGVLMRLVNHYAVKYERDTELVRDGSLYAGDMKISEEEING